MTKSQTERKKPNHFYFNVELHVGWKKNSSVPCRWPPEANGGTCVETWGALLHSQEQTGASAGKEEVMKHGWVIINKNRRQREETIRLDMKSSYKVFVCFYKRWVDRTTSRVTAGVDWGLGEVGPWVELPHFDSSPVQVSQCAGSSRGEGALFSLKGRAWCGGVGKRWRRFCMQGRQERTSNSVCIRKKPSVFVFATVIWL